MLGRLSCQGNAAWEKNSDNTSTELYANNNKMSAF